MMSIGELPADLLPTHLDLPCTDGKPVENDFQPLQSMLLRDSIRPHLDRINPDRNYFIGSDMGIYWRRTKEPLDGCKVPDWFYIPGVPRLLDGQLRRSYVLWQEKVHPLTLIEYVSGSGAEERDATPESGKFWVYEQIIQARYYLVYDPEREELFAFELIRGKYLPIALNENGRIAVPPMKLEFGIWQGEYQGAPSAWLRGWDSSGQLLPTEGEAGEIALQQAEEERKRAEEEHKRAEQERKRAEIADRRAEEERERANKLAARLRELGINPDTI